MKVSTMLLSIILCSSITALAAPAGAGAGEGYKSIPQCVSIGGACETAGYMPGEHKKDGKGLWIDCIGAIAHNKTVANVNATPASAQACLAAKRAAKKGA